jgi:hypothetical protein
MHSSSRLALLALTLALVAATAAFALSGCDDSLPSFAVPPPDDAGADAAAEEDAGADESED